MLSSLEICPVGFLVSLAAVVAVGCGSDDDGGKSGSGGSSGTSGAGGSGGSGASGGSGGGSGGTGGTSGTGATSGTGGSGGSGTGETPCMMKPPRDPGGMAMADADCCEGAGTCTATASIPASQVDALGLDDCAPDQDLKCAPNAMMVPATCRSIGDAEGRCIPECFLLGNASAGNLQQGSCAGGELCAPCYNPLDASETGACSQNGDAPVDAPPDAFASCAAPADGVCVPEEAVPETFSSALAQLDCAMGFLCAPRGRIEDPDACFAACDSGIGGAGACVPTFLVPMEFMSLLMQGTCEMGELCAPCVNPLDMMDTGACT